MMLINRALLYFAGLIILAGCSNAPQQVASSTPVDTRPNILFIVADDLGFTDIGSFGGEMDTPTLDELAYGGLRITNMHAGPACQQTRVMLMASTGHARGIVERPPLPNNERDNLLSMDWAIIPELLKDAGYATYATGKWDLGLDEGYTAATRGFDRSFVQQHGASSFFREYFFDPEDLGFEDDGVRVEIEDLDEDFYVTEHYTDKMLEYLGESNPGQPWFAYMPYTAPHWPLQLPDDWLDKNLGKYAQGYDELRQQRFESAKQAGVLAANASMEGFESISEPWATLSIEEQRKYARAQEIFAGMVEYLDMSIGRVITFLEETGQLENTVVIFTADHGASQGEFGVSTGRLQGTGGPKMPAGRNNDLDNFGRIASFIDHGRGFGEAASAPLKDLKGSLTEGGLRAAGFVYYPEKIKAGGVTDSYMTMMDFLPTFMEIAGTQHPGASTFNGREIKEIKGESAWQHFTGQANTVHGPDYTTGWSGRGGRGALIRGEYKLINTNPPGAQLAADWRLYNLTNDPGEHQNIAAENAAMVAEMVADWDKNWR